jgi:hypothetical protein
MKLNKWVKENGKWYEAKCLKFFADKGEDDMYASILMRASKLNNIDIHYLVNTLEDILFDRGYKKDEEINESKKGNNKRVFIKR